MKIDYSIFPKPRSLDNIYGAKLNHSSSIFKIKNELSFQELIEFVDKNHGIVKNLSEKFYGNPLPSSYENLGRLGKNVKIYDAISLKHEIDWTLLTIRKHRWEISLFIEYRSIFEAAFLLGDYEKAEKFLCKIEAEICYSIWTLENRLLLLEFKYSPEVHKTFLSDTNKTTKGYFVPYLAHFLSNRAEKNLAVSRYDLDIHNTLQKLKGDTAEQNRDFYYSRLNRFDYKNYKYLKDILVYDGYHSVIDRYNTLLFVIKLSIANNELDKDSKIFVKQRLRYLLKKFNDPTLKSLYKLYYQDFEKYNETEFDIKIYDLFTTGLYEDAINLLKQKLISSPSSAIYYVLYTQAFLYSEIEFVLPRETSSYQNTILRAIYNQLNRTLDPYESSINLQRIIKNLNSFLISDGLFKFLNDEVLSLPQWKIFNFLSYDYNIPEINQFYPLPELSKSYLKKLDDRMQNSISVKLNLLKVGDSYASDLVSLAIPKIAKQVETAKYYQKNNNFQEARIIWEEIVSETNHIVPILQIGVENLFNAYVELNEFDKAISFYVTNFIERAYIVYRIDVSKIHENIRRGKFRMVTPTIDLPLFYTFSKADENERHITYEKFNHAMGISRPSELTTEKFSENIVKWSIFLHQTCTTEIFKHSIFIDGSKDGYSERIAVCRYLLSIDKDNEELYKNEINDLTDLLIIQEGLQQLDESKIYVNESGLINSELREFEGLYNRFRTIANIYKESNKSLVIIDKRRGVRLASVEDVADELFKDRYSTDPLRDAYADIFDVITRKFLFSKFGISAYLSTRIRHGVLLGEIRPIFEKFNLISQKDNISGKYREIENWNHIYSHLYAEQLNNLQIFLGIFSQQIDDIIQGLLVNSLQIRTEDENIEGWFDYYFDDTTLSLHAISSSESKDFSDFIKKVIEILWYRTDLNLEHIRDKIENEVKVKFNEKIADLTSKLQSIPLRNTPEIFTNINTCLTEIQNSLDRIASWFNRSGSQTSDFKLDKLITIVHENISHSYSKRYLKLSKFEVVDITLKGEFYMHFADIFRIFFDNALKHSDQNIDSIDAEVLVEICQDFLIITIKNNHPNNQNLREIIDHTNVNLNMRKLSTEGKSGFPKADKIIRSDLKNESNSYKFFEDEQNRFTVILSISLENLLA